VESFVVSRERGSDRRNGAGGRRIACGLRHRGLTLVVVAATLLTNQSVS